MKAGQRFVGHPVNVATGVVYSTHEDISILGKIDLVWERKYTTALLDKPPMPLGPGWTTRYFATLSQDKTDFRFCTPEGDVEIFADPQSTIDKGGIIRNLGTFQEIVKHNQQYIITRWDVDTGEIERFIFKQGKKGETWPLEGIENVTGQRLDLIRDSAGRLTGIQQRLEKRILLIEYIKNNRINSISSLLPDNRQQVLVRYEYDEYGNMCTAYDALGYADRYEYDKRSRMTREIVKDGGVFYFKYDDKGRCIKTSGLDRYDEKSFRYLDAAHWTEVIDSCDRTFRYQYLPSGQMVREIDPLGRERKTDYDRHGRIVAESDPMGSVSRYTYDEYGNRASVIDALGRMWQFTFNDCHQILSQVDPANNVWTRTYDSLGRLVEMKDPLGACWRFSYDSLGNLASVTDPNGSSSFQRFSADNAILEATDWEGNFICYHRDQFGRTVKEVNATGGVTLYEYDLLGQLLAVCFPDGSHVAAEYDFNGNLIKVSDATGGVTHYEYGSCSRILSISGPFGILMTYQWGSEPERLESVTNDRGEEWIFKYDEGGRLIKEKCFDGGGFLYRYDQSDNCVAVTNGAGETVSYEYDALGHVIAEKLPDGILHRFKYDVLGNLIEAVSPRITLKWDRDALGRTVRETQGSYSVVSRYDAAGNRIAIETSCGLQATQFFNRNGQLIRVRITGTDAVEIMYDQLGNPVRRAFLGGANMEMVYDSMNRLIGQTAGGTSAGKIQRVGFRRSYQYNKAGTVVALNDAVRGETTYEYDIENRLLRAKHLLHETEEFAYDRQGNITSLSRSPGEKSILDYGAGDRLQSCSGSSFSYDQNGRLIAKFEDKERPKEWKFEWNADDLITSVTTPKNTWWEYSYDPLGRRISKRGPDGDVSFVWDGDVVVHELKNGVLSSTWIFEEGTFTPLCTLQKGKLWLLINDHLETPLELIDKSGTIVSVGNFLVWGAMRSTNRNLVDCPLRFQGQWFDAETGLHYNRYRYYDPMIARFISKDPLGLAGGPNAYQYVTDPVNCVDPYGLAQTKVGAAVKVLTMVAAAALSPSNPEAAKVLENLARSEAKAELEKKKMQERTAQGKKSTGQTGPPIPKEEPGPRRSRGTSPQRPSPPLYQPKINPKSRRNAPLTMRKGKRLPGCQK